MLQALLIFLSLLVSEAFLLVMLAGSMFMGRQGNLQSNPEDPSVPAWFRELNRRRPNLVGAIGFTLFAVGTICFFGWPVWILRDIMILELQLWNIFLTALVFFVLYLAKNQVPRQGNSNSA